MLLAKKDGDEQVLLAEVQAWMESSSDSDQEISANMVFMAKMEKVLSDSEESSSSIKETIAEESYYSSDSEIESEYETSKYYDNSTNYGLFIMMSQKLIIMILKNTFHVSNLKKCYSDDPLVVPLEGLQVDDKLHFVEEPVEIMDREVKQLRRSRVPIVKVRWNSRRGPEFTWEREDQFRKKYPHLFTKTAPSSSAV
ncbi:hypothetical protein Tco_0509200 [Tanacetum coccineum]